MTDSFVKAAAPPGAKTLEAQWYTSPEIFTREQEHVFAGSWIAVGREEQIRTAGDYFLAELAGESLIVVRDSQGRPRAFYNVCRHRGTRLCTEPEGHLKNSIQCPYHAWTYGIDGALQVARNMEGLPDFDRAEYPLREARLEPFEGFLFLSLDAIAPPFETTFAPLFGRFAAWHLAQLRVARRIVYDVRANWKLIFQNYSECYHCPVIHPQLERISPSESGRNDLTHGPFLGGFSLLREGTSLTLSGRSARQPLGNVAGEDLHRAYYYTLFPSLLLSLHPDYAMTHYVRPVAVDRTQIVCEWLFAPDEMAREGFDAADAAEFWDLTNRQDWNINELAHAGLTSRAYTPGPYAQQEGLLAAFDRYYLSLMA